MKKVVLLASLGTGLEYYDFIIYALLANFTSQLFFPFTDHLTGLMAAYGIFAVGYFSRPLGGIIFGILADKFGRKKVFSTSMLIMASSTFLMGLTPTYKHCGIFAALLFLTLRIIQGFSYGAELPVSLTFLVEHAHEKSRGKDCGWMLSSITIGVMFGNLVMYILSHFVSNTEILSWGWRLPFILGGVLAIPVYFVRKHAQETPIFKKDSYSKNIFIGLFKHNLKNIFLSLSMLLFPASAVTFMLTLPSYLQGSLGFRSTDVYLMLTLGYIWTAFLTPFAGRFSDYIERKRQLTLIMIIFISMATYLFKLLNDATLLTATIFILTMQTIISLMAGSYFVLLTEYFPTQFRCTGVAFCYNLAYIVAATIPTLFNYILKTTQHITNMVFLFMALALLTLFSSIWALKLKNNFNESLTESRHDI